MHEMTFIQSGVGEVRIQILRDIQRRGLAQGERYLTAREAAQMLGVSSMMADRAMQELASQGVLERRKKAGTFIGPQAPAEIPTVALPAVHLLMYDDYFRMYRGFIDAWLYGIHSELPDAALQITFLPARDEPAFVRQLVEPASGKTPPAVVLYASTPEIQRVCRDAGIPAVVCGTAYPSLAGLPWMDRDQRQIGCLLGQYAVRRGHRRIALLLRDRWGYGDNLTMDGLQQVMEEAGLGTSAFMLRSLPADMAIAQEIIAALLAGSDRPTGLICRSDFLAEAAARAVAQLGRAARGAIEIMVCEPSAPAQCRYVCIRPTIPLEEQSRMLGRMIRQLVQGQRPDPAQVVIPVTVQKRAT